MKPKFFDNPLRHDRSNAFDQSGGEIFLNPKEGSRYGDFKRFDLELLAESLILYPFTCQFYGFTRVDTGKITHNGGQFLLFFFPEFCHHKVIFFIVVGDPFEKAVNDGHCLLFLVREI